MNGKQAQTPVDETQRELPMKTPNDAIPEKLPTRPYLHLNRSELNKAYKCSKWNKQGLTADECIEKHVAFANTVSEELKRTTPFGADVPYGPGDKQKLDILLPLSLPKDCPIFAYLHGGYWQALGHENSDYPALPIYQAGGAFISIGYDLSPQVTLETIVNQVKEAVKYILQIAKERGSRGVYLSGHSAGAHLAVMMLAVDWKSEAGLAESLIKGVVLIGGIYDVRPLIDTDENINLQLTEESAWDLSPFRFIDEIALNHRTARILVVYGDFDPPETIRQGLEFTKALCSAGAYAEVVHVPNEDHFTEVERLTERDFILTKEILKLMNLETSQ